MYKKISFFLITFLLTMMITGCGKQTLLNDSYAIVYENGTPYLINEVEDKYSLAKYDYIVNDFNDYITVGKNKNGKLLYGFIKKNGQEVIKPKYLWASVMREEKAVVTTAKGQQIINAAGKVIYKFKDGTSSSSYFSDNYLLVEIDNKVTFLNSNFELLDLTFDYATPFQNGYACVGVFENNQMKYGYLRSDGTLLETPNGEFPFDFVDNFNMGLARVGYLNMSPAKETTPGVDNYLFNYLKEDGSLLLDDNKIILNEKSYILEYAQNFSPDGVALVGFYQMIKESTSAPLKPYIQYYFLNSNGKIASERINSGGMIGDLYFPGMLVGGTFRCRYRAMGAGAWKMYTATYNEDTDIYRIDVLEDTDLSNNPDLSNTPPTEMTNFRFSEYYSEDVSLAKIRISSGYYGLINSSGSLVLSVKYDKIIY